MTLRLLGPGLLTTALLVGTPACSVGGESDEQRQLEEPGAADPAGSAAHAAASIVAATVIGRSIVAVPGTGTAPGRAIVALAPARLHRARGGAKRERWWSEGGAVTPAS